LLC
ncbi:Branched-chain amino acid transport system 2 carrier protein, partial [Haemophilus influenzae]|jgi:renal tumor antigen